MVYDNSLTIGQAREIYFQNSGFDESSYTDKWVRLPVWKGAIYLPNLAPRRKAVPLHDIDHILTEYATDWPGEWQISSYELGTGCGKYWIGWLINLQAVVIGALVTPRACIRALARGRASRGVYRYLSHESLLRENLGELRKKTTAPIDIIRPSFKDATIFYLYVLASIGIHLVPLLLLGALVKIFW